MKNEIYPEKGVKIENKICGQTCGCLSEYDCHISKEDFVKRQLENNIPEGYKGSTLETLKYMFELGFENGVNFQELQPANNDYSVKESQWVSVQERFPETESLLLTTSKKILIGDWYDGIWRVHGKIRWAEKIEGGFELLSDLRTGDITHWMPMPTLPSSPTIKPINRP